MWIAGAIRSGPRPDALVEALAIAGQVAFCKILSWLGLATIVLPSSQYGCASKQAVTIDACDLEAAWKKTRR
jgi:hypothetical protein